MWYPPNCRTAAPPPASAESASAASAKNSTIPRGKFCFCPKACIPFSIPPVLILSCAVRRLTPHAGCCRAAAAPRRIHRLPAGRRPQNKDTPFPAKKQAHAQQSPRCAPAARPRCPLPNAPWARSGTRPPCKCPTAPKTRACPSAAGPRPKTDRSTAALPRRAQARRQAPRRTENPSNQLRRRSAGKTPGKSPGPPV